MRVPLVTALNVVKPNPIANRLANISFSISEPIHVLLNIYDVSGKLIKTLANTQLVSGNYHYIWNGNDEQNRAVAKGVYFYSLETPKQNFTRKMIFVR
jgi:flagellar hook assembly protein FlgD